MRRVWHRLERKERLWYPHEAAKRLPDLTSPSRALFVNCVGVILLCWRQPLKMDAHMQRGSITALRAMAKNLPST
jgi:hypothetical protein